MRIRYITSKLYERKHTCHICNDPCLLIMCTTNGLGYIVHNNLITKYRRVCQIHENYTIAFSYFTNVNTTGICAITFLEWRYLIYSNFTYELYRSLPTEPRHTEICCKTL